MTPVTTHAIHEALTWRCATKKFDTSRKIPATTWSALEQALVLAPSSFGLQPWHFVVVTDEAVKKRLAAASYGQNKPAECSHMVVFARRTSMGAADVDHYVARVAEVQGATVDSLKGYRDMMVATVERLDKAGALDAWMARQVYIALGQFITAAALLGVDTGPMEGLEPAKYDEILGLSAKGYTTLAGCPAGYRASDDAYAARPKVRFPADEVITHV